MLASFLASIVCLVLPTLTFCGTVQRYGMPIKYTLCGPDVIKEVNLSPCTSLPCVFQHGQNVTVSIAFNTAGEAVPKLSTKVFGIVEGIAVPFPLPQSDGCHNCNLVCPIQQGTHQYINTFPVLKQYPDIRLPVKWELMNGDTTVLCFVFPMSIEG